MSPVDLTPTIKDFQNRWVALSEDEKTVYGVGDTAQATIQDAESKGHRDFVLFFVRPLDLRYA